MGGPLERSERGGEASTEQSEGDSLVATPGVPHRVIPNAQRSQQLKTFAKQKVSNQNGVVGGTATDLAQDVSNRDCGLARYVMSGAQARLGGMRDCSRDASDDRPCRDCPDSREGCLGG